FFNIGNDNNPFLIYENYLKIIQELISRKKVSNYFQFYEFYSKFMNELFPILSFKYPHLVKFTASYFNFVNWEIPSNIFWTEISVIQLFSQPQDLKLIQRISKFYRLFKQSQKSQKMSSLQIFKFPNFSQPHLPKSIFKDFKFIFFSVKNRFFISSEDKFLLQQPHQNRFRSKYYKFYIFYSIFISYCIVQFVMSQLFSLQEGKCKLKWWIYVQ
ncbi:hypothetical protein IMG5_059910, partial [Ichthyophthirius multifiliis]